MSSKTLLVVVSSSWCIQPPTDQCSLFFLKLKLLELGPGAENGSNHAPLKKGPKHKEKVNRMFPARALAAVNRCVAQQRRNLSMFDNKYVIKEVREKYYKNHTQGRFNSFYHSRTDFVRRYGHGYTAVWIGIVDRVVSLVI